MAYPKNDSEYEESTVKKVTREGKSYSIERADGWSMWCGDDCPIVPEVGQTARFYGRGIGHDVRGLFINGVKCFYRTQAQHEEHREISLYGKDAADWLKRWDSDQSVWSIELGGLGPAYEQCIQVCAAEALRWYLKHVPASDLMSEGKMDAIRKRRDKWLFANPVIADLGLSGAQHGVAMNLAGQLHAYGPRAMFTGPAVKDRLIQVRRRFPDPYAKL